MMRGLCSSKCLNILSHSFENFSAVLGKVLAPAVSSVNAWQLLIKKRFGALLTDPSKAFNCLSHDLQLQN